MSIPFHLPNLLKPQKQYNFNVDNFNPFPHKSLCGTGPVHPAEQFDPLDFVSCFDPNVNISPPLPMESTSFKLIETVEDLRYLVAKLSEVDEFAVDLEHNSYRSFQGITCLMQISTRSEDFVVDTLKLWHHIGEYLRDVFMDPSKRKIIHGADNDVMWLQRDFDIYVVNLFDTMRASQVLKLERNSLEYLLKYYCNVVANKEYQCSDWRIRPLPVDMVKYAREDTHYLVYIYDLMKKQLCTIGSEELLLAYKRSYEVGTRLYSLEVFDRDMSYLKMYGLSDAGLDGEQLGLIAALYEWRNKVSREEDESVGYVLPNKLILEIAKRRPGTKQELLELVGYGKEFVLRDANLILNFMWTLTELDAVKFKEAAFRLVKESSRRPESETLPRVYCPVGYGYRPAYVARAPAMCLPPQPPRVYATALPYGYVNGPFVMNAIHCL